MIRVIVALTVFALLSVNVRAHMDPLGDVHPRVRVEDGNFAIYFHSNSDRRSRGVDPRKVRVVYSPEGKLLAPRHYVGEVPEAVSEAAAIRWNMVVADGSGQTVQFPRYDRLFHGKPFYLTRTNASTQRHRLPWPEGVDVSILHDVVMDERSIMIAAKARGSRLSFYHFDRSRFVEPAVLEIGDPVSIYEMSVASNMVFAGGRYWIAWMRFNEKEISIDTMLTHWTPGDKQVMNVVLKTPGYGNSSLSLATNGDVLCLAYHGSSRILTHFEPVK